MVIGNPEAVAAANAANTGGNGAGLAHPSGIPQDQIDNIMSGIANTGDVKMNNHRKKLRQRFDIIKKLGQGTYGKVQLGINKETGQEVAIKTIKKCKIEAEADLVRIRREVQIMSSVQHPNIIHIYEVFENREKMVLVMEFAAGGELYDYLSERKVLAEEEARRIFRQVATAVYYCHKHKICHRDLKLENILLDEQGNAKIADFGLSNVFDDQRLLATFCGSPLYASPEIVEGTPYQGPEVDCWSLGVLLYTLVYGSMPFDGSNFKRLVKQISQGDYYEPKKPSRASSLIRDMLTVCPRKRATIEQICSHWWVNEHDNVSCLELAEDLANRTPVRLDVLLSLTPTAITADQLVVPSAADGTASGKGNERVPRSHSVGSIRDIAPANTEAERKILDMVAAGGEAALMPSPTRTITPAQSPVQTKRKLQPTVSTENAMGTTAKKKEKPANNASFVISETTAPLNEETPMETEGAIVEEPETPAPTTAAMTNNIAPNFSHKDMMAVGELCEQLIDSNSTNQSEQNNAQQQQQQQQQQQVQRQKTAAKLDAVDETPEEKDATKVIKKFVNKHKTADLVNAITQATPTAESQPQQQQQQQAVPPPFVRKCSLQDETPLNKFNAERRKSRILETAEKFQAMNAGGADKPKKFVIPGVSVGSFKKEYERKASTTTPAQGPTAGERRALEQVAAAAAAAQDIESIPSPPASPSAGSGGETAPNATATLEASDSKNSVSSISLEEARRSMENSIALLRQAQNESSKEVDQLCAKTESIGVSEPAVVETERERKLKNARAIIGNAIQPVIRRPTPFYGIGGVGGGGGSVGYDHMHAISGSFISGTSDNGSHMPFEQMSYSAPVAPTTTTINTPPILLTPSSHVALAAAKKTIQDRLFAGGVPQLQQQQQQQHQKQQHQRMQTQQQQQQWHLPATTPPLSSSNHHQINHNHGNSIFYPNMNTLPTPFNASPFKMMQQQLQQKCNEAKQLQQQQQYGQFKHISNNHPNQYQVHNSNMFTPPPSPLNAPVALSVAKNNTNTTTTTTSQTAAILNANAYANNANANSFNNSRRPMPFHLAQDSAMPAAMWLKSSPGGDAGAVKTSTASITLKSATLPRRKATAKADIQLEIQPRIVEQPAMRFTTEMQHPVADLRSAPPREGPVPYSPIKTVLNARATSLEPKEHIIPIQRPPQSAYTRTTSNTTTRSGSLSRQSTVDSESDTTTATNISQSTITGSSQPIKKSPREFIIPIAVEGGGFITPREGSIEPSESGHTTTSSRTTFNRFRPSTTRRIGSLLSDAGIEEGSPFQKMRTASITRDGDDDSRFTLHRLRSSRPVKKISQDNDSQSSGEEDDDDDGFEILTAENLFSTLLQRVRALTNRLNVNNDFPSSSRLISNMRQGQSPFWNQQSPFGSRLNSAAGVGNSSNSAASSGLGAPWRHSMSRDLGSDMESMFSRTGATLPRGTKSSGKRTTTTATITSSNTTNTAAATASTAPSGEDRPDGKVPNATAVGSAVDGLDEPLDLADLDLSRLRLSKQDLETLSSITPGLPKCFQEQLLAKLPPTQARKLSRTLSMQNSTPTPVAGSSKQVYKRSQSGGRGCIPESSINELKLDERHAIAEESKSPPLTDAPTTTAASSAIYRRSMSRTRYDYESSIPTPTTADTSNSNSAKSRSNSVCRDDYGKSALSGTFTSDINDKYKYYSPYLSKSSTKENSSNDGATSPQKRYSVGLGRPPSGCLSPPLPVDSGSSSLRRRSSQRRISRFLRPDFFDEPPPSLTQTHDESSYQREKRQRERETQSVLREIREKSMDRLTVGNERDDILRRKHSLPNVEATAPETGTHLTPTAAIGSRHVRNKSMEMYIDGDERRSTSQEASHNRRSLSRPRELNTELDKHELADKILQELQLLSAVRTQHENRLPVPREMHADTQLLKSDKKTEESYSEKTATIKRVKKLKPKEKSAESSTDIDGKVTTTTVVKKVKKIVKKSESVKTPKSEISPEIDEAAATEQQSQVPLKETKLKRPKSYPMKDSALSVSTAKAPTGEIGASAVPSTSKLPCKTAPNNTIMPESTECAGAATIPRESRLMRPKSYPASKLAPTKDLKKVTRSGAAIPSSITEATESAAKSSSAARQIDSDDKSQSVTPPSNGLTERETSSSGDTRPTSLKKVVKVTKKSKLVPPTPLTPTTPTTTTTTTPADSSKESSPATIVKAKEKSPEKKPSKGLLYAIGQKFEKLRDSAMSKEKKAMMTAGNATAISQTPKKSSPENSSPEKIKEKTLLKKKKSLDTEKKLETTSKNAKSISRIETLDKPLKSDKRSRIDSMIRTLRERSVPRTHVATESNYIKRAVSVEDMPGTFNKNAVNRVLGLFKRFEKDGSERKVRSTRSTSNIERQLREGTPSPIYENAVVIANAKAVNSKTNNSKEETVAVAAVVATANEENCNCETVCPECIQNETIGAKRREEVHAKTSKEVVSKDHTLQSNKEKRKGLMLDLAKLERMDNVNSGISSSGGGGGSSSAAVSGSSYRSVKPPSSLLNGNGLYSNLPPYPGAVKSSSNNSSSQQSMDNVTNNNSTMTNNNSSSLHTSQTSGYRTASAHEINRNNLLTPSFENIANYSSDSRSYQDDCASTSTFLSPTDEPELYFDNWSICSEDNYMLHASPSPTVSRLSRASQLSSPTRCSESSDPNESVIDRIKRRSFYCRFNEKKPKRTSSIVGPSAVRDYYREQQAAVKSRTASKVSIEERAPSPDIAQQFFRPLKLSPVGTELKPPVYRSALDYTAATSKPRKSLNDIRTTTSPSFLTKRYGSTTMDNDYTSVPMRYKSSSSTSPYESNGGTGISSATGGTSGYYSTYNPKRRSSYTLNGTLSGGSGIGAGSSSLGAGTSHIDGYATVGRRAIRAYDQRTMSLLEPTTSGTGSTYHRRDARTPVRDYTSSISRSNSRYRMSSATRSPTNI